VVGELDVVVVGAMLVEVVVELDVVEVVVLVVVGGLGQARLGGRRPYSYSRS